MNQDIWTIAVGVALGMIIFHLFEGLLEYSISSQNTVLRLVIYGTLACVIFWLIANPSLGKLFIH